MYQKLKSLLDSDLIFTLVLLGLVAITAFMLGRYSVATPIGQNNSLPSAAPVQLIANPVPAVAGTLATEITDQTVSQGEEKGEYVASKSGTKYHHISCPGAKQIKEENQIWFATVADATAAGYTKAANCDR